jgi:hypothetical protein
VSGVGGGRRGGVGVDVCVWGGAQVEHKRQSVGVIPLGGAVEDIREGVEQASSELCVGG